jgi:glycosyltransferase involved in cell wall biosynthesis
MITVSVVIPCYNAEAWVRDSIKGVFSQEVSATDLRLEVIAVDDGSRDETAAIIAQEFPTVQVISTPNRGASRARNSGTDAATGEFIQYLDADDLLAPGKIAAQIRALEESGADVAYGDWQRLQANRKGDFILGEIVARKMQRDPELELFGDFWCPPAAYLFRRRIVQRVGKWNERLPIIQDARFALDCALHGGTFVYCPGVMALYREHGPSSLSRRDPVAFVRDVYANAIEVERWWLEHGGLSDVRVQSLADCYGYVARSCYARDKETFEMSYADLMRIAPNYVPRQPRYFAAACRLLGYRNAEAAASIYRRARRICRAELA